MSDGFIYNNSGIIKSVFKAVACETDLLTYT